MDYFNMGVKKYKAKDYTGALQCFELNLQSNPEHLYTIFNLILVNIHLSDLKRARKIYVDNYALIKSSPSISSNNPIILEFSELNYLEALKLEYEYIKESNDMFALKELANINMDLGNVGVTKKIFETMILSENERIKVQNLWNISEFYMQLGDYEKAAYYCNLIDFGTYTKYYPAYYYFNAKAKLDACLGIGKNYSYLYKVIKTHDEELLINHIMEHCNQEDKYTKGCFFENIDIPSLLEEVRKIIPTINGSYIGDSITYYYRFDKPVGYLKEEVTNDLCIIKHCSGQILSMYPCSLSDNFNKEGWLTSEKLRLKRERGMQNEK